MLSDVGGLVTAPIQNAWETSCGKKWEIRNEGGGGGTDFGKKPGRSCVCKERALRPGHPSRTQSPRNGVRKNQPGVGPALVDIWSNLSGGHGDLIMEGFRKSGAYGGKKETTKGFESGQVRKKKTTKL